MSERFDQSIVITDPPTVAEVSTLLSLANRQRLQEREARERLIQRALNQARRG